MWRKLCYFLCVGAPSLCAQIIFTRCYTIVKCEFFCYATCFDWYLLIIRSVNYTQVVAHFDPVQNVLLKSLTLLHWSFFFFFRYVAVRMVLLHHNTIRTASYKNKTRHDNTTEYRHSQLQNNGNKIYHWHGINHRPKNETL